MTKSLLRYWVIAIALFASFYATAQEQAVAFIYSQSMIFVRVRVNNARGLLFLLNTGANTSVLDNKVADKLNLFPTSYKRDSVVGTAGKESIGIIKIKTMQLGDAEMQNMQITRRDLSKFIKCNNQQIDGVLGTDFLQKFAIEVDFRTHKLKMLHHAVNVDKWAYIPFELVGGIPRVEARFNDTFSTYLRYNSGLGFAKVKDIYINVSPTQWCKLKTLDQRLQVQRYMTGEGVGGEVRLQVVDINKVQFRGMMVKFPFIIIQPREGYFLDERSTGFFGNNMLEKYNRVVLDFIGRQIIFNTVRRSTLPS